MISSSTVGSSFRLVDIFREIEGCERERGSRGQGKRGGGGEQQEASRADKPSEAACVGGPAAG